MELRPSIHPLSVAMGVLAAGTIMWLAHVLWHTPEERYRLVSTSDGRAYQVDGATGDAWRLEGAARLRVLDSQERPATLPILELPDDARRLVINTGTIDRGRISGELYNGCDEWRITEALFWVTATERDGSMRWERAFRCQVAVEPLSVGYFSVAVSDVDGIAELDPTPGRGMTPQSGTSSHSSCAVVEARGQRVAPGSKSGQAARDRYDAARNYIAELLLKSYREKQGVDAPEAKRSLDALRRLEAEVRNPELRTRIHEALGGTEQGGTGVK